MSLNDFNNGTFIDRLTLIGLFWEKLPLCDCLFSKDIRVYEGIHVVSGMF